MNPRDLHHQKDDALFAQQILDNPLWQRLIADIRAEYFQKLINCPARDREGRDIYLTQMKAVEQVIGTLTQKVNGGSAAEADLERYARTDGKISQLARRFT